MNKKFFTLLVALLTTISFGAFAQTFTKVEGKAFSSTKQYFLSPDGTNFLVVVLTDAGPKLVMMDKASIIGYSGLRLAGWKVKVTKVGQAAAPTYELTNIATDSPLALGATLDSDYGAAKYKESLNAVTGDMNSWLATRTQTTSGATELYWLVPDKEQVNGLFVTAFDDKDTKYDNGGSDAFYKAVVAKNVTAEDFDDPAFNGFTTFEFYEATGTFALNANDLNTLFGTAGDVDNGVIVANTDSYFNLTTTPVNTYASPFTHTLQARVVEQKEVKYSTGSTGNNAVMLSTTNATMHPLGTIYDEVTGKADESNILSSVRNFGGAGNEWYALYSKDADAYLVVDTAYVPGTKQANNGLIEITTDKLYNAKNETRYRLAESYLFQFLYNASNNSITVVSKGYVTEQTNRVKTGTTLSTFYNDYVTPAVQQGSFWPAGLVDGTTTYTGVNSSGADVTGIAITPQKPLAVVTDLENYTVAANKVLLTPAKLVNEIVYTLGATIEENFVATLGTSKQYTVKRLNNGAYLLKVVGVANSANSDRVGKYLKMNLAGMPEFVTMERRQDFQEMPSAQWVIETTGTSTSFRTSIKNREFEDIFTLANGAAYLGTGLTYQTETAKQFFFLGGDTLAYEEVTAPLEKKLGYKYVDVDGTVDLNRYEFRFLHELQMDKPISTLTDKDSAMWVDVNDDAIKFQLVKVADDTYGYTYDSKKLAKLERTAYKLKVYYSSNFEVTNSFVTYDAKNKKYYLTKSEADASVFLMKANNFANEFNYYILLEANTTNDLDVVKIKDVVGVGSVASPITGYEEDGSKIANIIVDKDIKFGTTGYAVAVEEPTGVDENGLPKNEWNVRVFNLDATDDDNNIAEYNALLAKYSTILYPAYLDAAMEEAILIVVGGNNNSYASTKVAVDNNTLSLVNGVIYDAYNGEVNNSAFKVERDETIIYRTLGVEEDEEEDINFVKFFRVNSAATGKEYLYEDANSVYSNGIGMNMLGVEGKGMDKLSSMKARYTTGDVMPQYLISVGEETVEGTDPVLCPECGGEDPNCTHNYPGTEGYITGRFLVNLIDSVAKYKDSDVKNDFLWEKQYTRLAFVDGILNMEETQLSILNDKSNWDLTKNQHAPVLFQFRLLEDGSNDFLIESESWNADNDNAFAGGIAPAYNRGGWVKIQNGVPVIVNRSEENYNSAEIFNLEVTDELPTSNAGIEAGEVKVVAGQGYVTIKGAAGEQVIVANILGQVIANKVLTYDEETIAVPAGVVVVSVNGAATKALVK